jgi:hypothetical protein
VGRAAGTKTPGVIRGALRDGATGQPVAAKIRVTDMTSGRAYLPEHAIKTMPQKTAPGVSIISTLAAGTMIVVPLSDRSGSRDLSRGGYRQRGGGSRPDEGSGF